MSQWSWWLSSDAGLIARIAIGSGIFLTLAIIDFLRNRSRATRWREYAFLLAATAVAMLYGMANDGIASGISWEYFYYGKGASATLGPAIPPAAAALRFAAIGIGLRATWTVGLLIGAVLLIANNPSPKRKQASYRKLLAMLLVTGGIAALSAAAAGFIGSRGGLNWTNSELKDLWQNNEFRPTRFLTVYGMNLGGYLGGALGTIGAVFRIRAARRRHLDNAKN